MVLARRMVMRMRMRMTANTFPWEKIKIPANKLNLLRVSSEHPHNFFWGRDAGGHYLLVVKCEEEDLQEGLTRRKIELSGIKTSFRLIPDTDEAFMMILLQEAKNADIFFTLCNDLIQKTKPVKEIGAAMEILFSRLERWRSFLSRTRKKLMSDREVQGLFSELKFMEECLDQQIASPAAVIEGWYGSLGAPHDFVFDQSAVEIKSVAGSQSDSVPISSENQLQTHLEHLYLNVFLLSRDADCTTGMSLNNMVRQMRERFTKENLQNAFEERLMESDYIDISEYDLPCFSVSEIRTYLVGEEFPRITPDIIPQGIKEVSYRITFSSISDYLCDISAIGGNG